MLNPITRRIRNVVVRSFAYCHGGCEFEPHHCTFLCAFFFSILYFVNLFIYLFIDVHVIQKHFKTNLVAEYRFSDI